MTRSPRRVNAVMAVETGSDQDRVARALYEHDALQASAPWLRWEEATRPKRLRYLDRARVAISALRGNAAAAVR